MISGLRAIVVLVGLVPAATAGASRPLTYREALAAAAEANPSLRKTGLAVQQAEGSVVSAWGTFDPLFAVNGNWSRNRSREFFPGSSEFFGIQSRFWALETSLDGALATGTSYSLSGDLTRRQVDSFSDNDALSPLQDQYNSSLTASLTQQLLEGVRFRYNLRNVTLARQSLAVAELEAERAFQDLLKQAADAYWTWVYRTQLRQIASDSVAVAEEALRVGELKVGAGELAPVEKTRLEAALVQAQANLLDADANLEQAANGMLLVMGEDPGQDISPATDPGTVPDLDLDPSLAIDVALQQNLDLAVARANLDTAELSLRNTRHERLPSLSVTGTVGTGAQSIGEPITEVQQVEVDFLGETFVVDEEVQVGLRSAKLGDALGGVFGKERLPTLGVAGRFSVPLGNRGAKGSVDSAAAARMQRRVELEELERTVSAQVEQQVRVLASARRRVELADVNLRLAEETLRAEEALAEAGRSIQKDVLEARTEVDRLRAEAARSRTDYRQAQAELLRLQGQLSLDQR